MRKILRYFNKHKTAYFFVLPLIITICAFLIYPLLYSLVMSFQDWYLAGGNASKSFVGFHNYELVLQDPYFHNSVKITLVYIVVTVLFRYALGFGAAMLLNSRLRLQGLWRSLIIIPWAVPEIVTCLVWRLMLNRDFGVINYILQALNITTRNIGFFEETGTALVCAMIVNIWKGFPFAAIMLLAGMQSVPTELYEVATVDGASSWQQFKNITLPLLRPISSVVFVLLVIWTIKDFSIIYNLALGGPARTTEVLTVYLYRQGFKFFDLSGAAAGGMIMLAFTLLFVILYLKILKRGEIDE